MTTFKIGTLPLETASNLVGVLDEIRITKGVTLPVADGIQTEAWPNALGGGGPDTGQGWVDITAARAGFTSETKRFTVTKAFAGQDGTGGTPGTPGVRGNINIAVITTGTSWSDLEAAAGIAAVGYGTPRTLDIVTLYRTDGTFSETRSYTGSAWIAVTQYLNGNLFVNGTISTQKLIIGAVTANVESTVNDIAYSPITSGVTDFTTPAAEVLNFTDSNGYVRIGASGSVQVEFPTSYTADHVTITAYIGVTPTPTSPEPYRISRLGTVPLYTEGGVKLGIWHYNIDRLINVGVLGEVARDFTLFFRITSLVSFPTSSQYIQFSDMFIQEFKV